MVILRRLFRGVIAWGIPGIVGLLVCAGWLSRAGFIEDINALSYDRFTSAGTRLHRTPAKVLLVYTDAPTESNPAAFQQLVSDLRNLGATAIGVLQLDASHWTDTQLAELTAEPSLVLGHVEGLSQSLATRLAPRCGEVQTLKSRDGILRSHYGRRPAATGSESGTDGNGESLEAKLARRSGIDARAIPKHEFLIHFRGDAESLPHVTSTEILDRDITASLVRDRVALIGRPSDAVTPPIGTPTTRDAGMSLLEFHGHALNSILTHSSIATLPQWSLDVLLAISTVVFIVAGRRIRLDRVLGWVVCLAVIQGLVVFLLLHRSSVWVPVSSLLMTQGAALLVSFNQRMRFSERAWELTRRRGFSVSPRYRVQPCLHADAEPWDQILAIFDHVFPLDAIALLRCPKGRGRLQMVAVSGVDEQHIVRRRWRRDETSFADAIERRSAARLDDDSPFFFRREGQAQFVCPLLHAGQLEGLIVVDISDAALAKIPGFGVQLTELSDEVATWLAVFTDLSHEAQERRRWWFRLGTNLEADTFFKLQMHLASIERRLHQSYDVIERASSGKAVFDLSGRVVTMNATMFRLLHRYGLASTDCRLLQVLRATSKRDALECRELVRDILMKGRHERLVVSDPEPGNSLVIVVQALVKTADAANDPQAMLAFNAQGLLVEVFETSMLDSAAEVRGHVAGAGLTAVDELLDDILSLTHDVQQTASHDVFHQLDQNVLAARQTVQSCQSMLSQVANDDLSDRLPVHLEAVVRSLLSETQRFCDKRLITVSVVLPKDLPHVDANPTRLRRALLFALEWAIASAQENSQVTITVRYDSQFVQVIIGNEGCGVAFDRLAGRRLCTATEESLASRLGEIQTWLAAWGGELLTDALLGEGASITLKLRRFSWARQLKLDITPVEPASAIATDD